MAEYGAELWRDCVLAVAPLTAVARASVFARECPTADGRNDSRPAVQARTEMGGQIARRRGNRVDLRESRPDAPIHHEAHRDPAPPAMIDRVRDTE